VKRWGVLFLLLASCGSSVPATLTIAADGITVTVSTRPYRYTVADASGTVVLASAPEGSGDGWGPVGWTTGQLFWGTIAVPGYFTFDTQLDPWRDAPSVTQATQLDPATLELTLSSGVVQKLAVRASTLRVENRATGDKPRAWSAAFSSPADEGFFGFGERFNRLDQRGLSLYSWAEEGGLGKDEQTPKSATNPWPNGETMTYYPVPFFVSTKGYAFWLDSTWRNQFDLATDHPDEWRVWDVGPSLAYEVYVPIPDDARPWPRQLVDLFTATVGRPMVPPAWAFGPRRRINRNAMVGSVLEAQAMRDADLALTSVDDALHFLPAGSELGIQPEVAAWTQATAALGLRAIGYYNPYVSKDPSPLDALKQQGLDNGWFLKSADGTPSVVFLISGKFLNLYTYDVTQPDAVASFTSQFQRAFDLGYSGWMYDFGEYVQPDVVASNGMSGEELHNLFPVLYDQAGHDALEAGPHKGDWFFFARSGYTGASQYVPVVWSGDPDASFDDALGLPSVVRAQMNIGVSGVPHWGSDIGGYKCAGGGHASADGELLARWIEFGALGSDMHDEDACAAAQDPGAKATIWTSSDAQSAWKTYARLHTRLFPYLYTLAQEAHQTGAPTVRPLFLEFPDPALLKIEDEYLVGPAILSAPVVTRGARSRTVTLPDGQWLDWNAGAVVSGTVTADAPLDVLPLYLREGQLIPLLDPTIDTLLDTATDATVVGPAKVGATYDVVGLVGASRAATLSLYDGTRLDVSWQGGFAAPALPVAATEAELATCAACWLKDGQRVRISASGSVQAGGLLLSAQGARRIRWDLFLVEP
jgi:alpha-glucosidase (family GH31 glycosyl hydrolase)